MWDQQIFEQLHQKFSSDLNNLEKSMEGLAILYRNLPVSEKNKKHFLDESSKIKSAWYACLINSNIDVLLIPEYLESKLSRNILIKKETEQYFSSIANFHLHTNQNPAVLFETLLYSDEVEPKSSFDLFSTQAPETSTCPEKLKNLFQTWNTKYTQYSNFESLLYSFLEWHSLNKWSFSSQRQCVLWFNYRLWSQFGAVGLKLPIENFLYNNWNKEICNPNLEIKNFIDFLYDEIENQKLELTNIYKEHIAFETLKSRQKLVSSYVFEAGFKIENTNNISVSAHAILKQILRKGFLSLEDISSKEDFTKQISIYQELMDLGIMEIEKESGEISLYINTAFKNKSSSLYKYQNIQVSKSDLSLNDFIQQTYIKPIISIEKPIIEEPVMQKASGSKRQKAFFG